MKSSLRLTGPALLLLAVASGCTLRTEHKVEPIEINMNIYLHVDKELDSFFKKIDAKDSTLNTEPAAEGKTK